MLQDTDGAANPFFSPDGQWIAFFSEGWLRKISVHGGVPVDLAEVSLNRGGTWPRDDLIVFAPTFNTPLMKLPASGGTPERSDQFWATAVTSAWSSM